MSIAGATGWVGRSIRRLEDPALIAGRGRFTADLPAAHRVRFVRSQHAAGRIVKIAAPKDVLMITAADLKDVKPIRPMLHKFDYVPIGQPVLATDRVRFVGEAIAAVVAPSEALAEDAADAVDVDIAPADALIDARAALADRAPRVHDEVAGNVIVKGAVETPEFAAARAGADRLVRVEVRSRRQNATPLEPRAGHAAFDPASGRITLTCSTQMPHLTRTAIADVLGLPEAQLRVVAPDVGGGFGQKMSLPPEYVLLVWLARELQRLADLPDGTLSFGLPEGARDDPGVASRARATPVLAAAGAAPFGGSGNPYQAARHAAGRRRGGMGYWTIALIYPASSRSFVVTCPDCERRCYVSSALPEDELRALEASSA